MVTGVMHIAHSVSVTVKLRSQFHTLAYQVDQSLHINNIAHQQYVVEQDSSKITDTIVSLFPVFVNIKCSRIVS